MRPTEKFCPRCKETKPADDFYKIKARHDGLSSYCKPCQVNDAKSRYDPHPRWKAPPGMKWCKDCQSIKPLAEFGRNKTAHDGYQNYCKGCSVTRVTKSRHHDPTSHREAAKRYREKHPERVADMHARWGVGAPVGTYAALLEAQDGKCAICRTTDPGGGKARFAIDHCHETGIIRGLLCVSCNNGLGRFKHNRGFLVSAAIYLEDHHGPILSPEGRTEA